MDADNANISQVIASANQRDNKKVTATLDRGLTQVTAVVEYGVEVAYWTFWKASNSQQASDDAAQIAREANDALAYITTAADDEHAKRLQASGDRAAATVTAAQTNRDERIRIAEMKIATKAAEVVLSAQNGSNDGVIRAELTTFDEFAQNSTEEVNEERKDSLSYADKAALEKLRGLREWAKKKGLPTLFFDELIAARIPIRVRNGTTSIGRPAFYNNNTINIYRFNQYNWSSIGEQAVPATKSGQLYNELFHAWYEHIFLKDSKYAAARYSAFQEGVLGKYRTAIKIPKKTPHAKIAQEEAWSETVNGLVVSIAYGKDITKTKLEDGAEAVGHAGVGKFSNAADNVRPGNWEYNFLRTLLGAPQAAPQF